MKNKKIAKIVENIENYLEGKGKLKGYKFSEYLEDTLCLEIDDLYEENQEVAQKLNARFPMICAMITPTEEETEFKEAVRKEYDRLKKLGIFEKIV